MTRWLAEPETDPGADTPGARAERDGWAGAEPPPRRFLREQAREAAWRRPVRWRDEEGL